MKNYIENSRILIRVSISLLFLWFGINQLVFPSDFIGYLPNFLLLSEYSNYVLIFNGIFEIIFGILLLTGFFTRFTSFILSIHLFTIIFSLGYNDIAVRDFILALITLSIFLGGKDKWCSKKY